MTETFGSKIVTLALGYVGEREIKNNQGFLDRKFDVAMREVGFTNGYAWCALFAELCYTQAYQGHPDQLKVIERLFSASAVATYRNFAEHERALRGMVRAPYFKTSREPAPGAVAVWRNGKSAQGHVGIVTAVHPRGDFDSCEGNTNRDGSREGVEVLVKRRHCDFGPRDHGLYLLGFILPWEVV